MRFFSGVKPCARFPRSLRHVALRYPARPSWSRSHLVPVLFVYALSELHIAFTYTCVRTYWDMWDHWDHP